MVDGYCEYPEGSKEKEFLDGISYSINPVCGTESYCLDTFQTGKTVEELLFKLHEVFGEDVLVTFEGRNLKFVVINGHL
ncbi:hypothetical protein [Vibrio phage vB_VpaP_SJSY21]|nr:hypothetical protein [Vibrio phage vB_VpaP_SJSY21]